MSTDTIKAYKRFDKNMCYKGFQYEIGKEYDTNNNYDDVNVSMGGFIGWICPMMTFELCNIAECRFALVEQSGLIFEDKEMMSVRSSYIKIVAELTLGDMIKESIEWIEKMTPQRNLIKSTRHNSNIITNDEKDKIYSSGFYDIIGSNGTLSLIASIGSNADITLNGDFVKLVSNGYHANISSNSNFSHIISSSSYATIASCGKHTNICSIGDTAIINSSGMHANICSLGKNALIVCTGIDNKARAKIGSWITFVEYMWINGHRVVRHIKTEQVDGEKIKADTWYQLVDGEFVETKLYISQLPTV